MSNTYEISSNLAACYELTATFAGGYVEAQTHNIIGVGDIGGVGHGSMLNLLYATMLDSEWWFITAN